MKRAILEMDSWARSSPLPPQFFSIFCQRSHSSVSWTLFPDVWNMHKKQPVNWGVFQDSAIRSQQSFGMKREGMLFMSSSPYRKESQLHLFIGNIINSFSNGESLSLYEKLILPPTQTKDRQKPHQNVAEVDAILRKPSSKLRRKRRLSCEADIFNPDLHKCIWEESTAEMLSLHHIELKWV